MEEDPGEPLAESAWIEPFPDGELGLEDGFAAPEARYERREAVELAFIAALQHLPPRQRAVLVLREVLGFSAREVAETMDSTVASVNSSLQRARATVEKRLPERSQQATVRSLGSARVRRLVERFIDAFERGDVDGILAMLSQDATFAMPPYARLYRGRREIAASWLIPAPPCTELRYLSASANCQPAIGAYRWDGAAELSPDRTGRAHAARRGDRRRHGVPGTVAPRAFRPAGRAAPSSAREDLAHKPPITGACGRAP